MKRLSSYSTEYLSVFYTGGGGVLHYSDGSWGLVSNVQGFKRAVLGRNIAI